MKNLTILLVLLSFGCQEKPKKVSWKIENGFVPNKETAIKVAEIILINIYGDEVLNKKPFKAELKNGVWIVEGTLKNDVLGGTPYIEISQDSCKVLKISHSK